MQTHYVRKMDMDATKTFILAQSPETKIYIGGDSERFRINGVWYADYTMVVVVHIDGKHGARIFGETVRERDYDQKKDKPSFRLMNEVYKISEMYLRMSDVLDNRKVEVHLDINPDERHGSSVVINQAIGYIKGTCNLTPKVKPSAFAASYAADRYGEISQIKGYKEVA